MCHESLIGENCFRPYGRKGLYGQELNNWGCYAVWPRPTDMETLARAAAATYSETQRDKHDTRAPPWAMGHKAARAKIQLLTFRLTCHQTKLHKSRTFVVGFQFQPSCKTTRIYVTEPACLHQWVTELTLIRWLDFLHLCRQRLEKMNMTKWEARKQSAASSKNSISTNEVINHTNECECVL